MIAIPNPSSVVCTAPPSLSVVGCTKPAHPLREA